MAKVSIIIPVYKAESGIRRCLNSILQQEFSDIEVLPVDDGSPDQCGNILDEYAAKDHRVHPLHQKNQGVSAARNAAIAKATGTYMQFVDADDYLPINSTKMLVRYAEDYKADLVVGAFYRVSQEYVSIKNDIDAQDVMDRKTYASCMLAKPSDLYYGVLWNKLYRRDLIMQNRLCMDTDLNWCEDTVFNMEYTLHINRVIALPVPIYYYVRTEGSLVRDSMELSRIVKMKEQIVRYYDDFYKNLYNVDETAGERLQHIRFLFSFATDDPVIGKGYARIGKETNLATVNTDLEDNMVTMMYYMHEVYTHYLRSVAFETELSLDEMEVLNCLMFHCSAIAMKEIAAYAGLSITACFAAVGSLVLKKMVKVNYLQRDTPVELTSCSKEVLDKLRYAVQDLENICLNGFDEKEKQQQQENVQRMNKNLKKLLEHARTSVR